MCKLIIYILFICLFVCLDVFAHTNTQMILCFNVIVWWEFPKCEKNLKWWSTSQIDYHSTSIYILLAFRLCHLSCRRLRFLVFFMFTLPFVFLYGCKSTFCISYRQISFLFIPLQLCLCQFNRCVHEKEIDR